MISKEKSGYQKKKMIAKKKNSHGRSPLLASICKIATSGAATSGAVALGVVAFYVAFYMVTLATVAQARPVIIGGDGKPSVEINERLIYGVGSGLPFLEKTAREETVKPPLIVRLRNSQPPTNVARAEAAEGEKNLFSGSVSDAGASLDRSPAMPRLGSQLGVSNQTIWIADSEVERNDLSSTIIKDTSALEVAEDGPALGVAEDGPALGVAEDGPALEVAEDGPALEVAEDGPALEVAEDIPALEVAEDGPALEVAEDGPALEVAEDGPALEVAEDGPALEKRGQENVAPPSQMMASLETPSTQMNPDLSGLDIAEADFTDDIETTDEDNDLGSHGLEITVPPPPDLDMDRSFRVSAPEDEIQAVVSQDEIAAIDSVSDSLLASDSIASDSDNGEPVDLIGDRFDEQVAALPPDAPPAASENRFLEDTISIFFRPGSASLDDDALQIVGDIAERLEKSPGMRLQVLAFAELIGNNPSKARRLSLSRAMALRTALSDNGIDNKRMDIKALGGGYGDDPPNRADVVIVSP